MPESDSPTDRRPKFCRPLAERKTSSVGASARRYHSSSLPSTSCSTSLQIPGQAIPSCRARLLSRRTSELSTFRQHQLGLRDCDWKIRPCGRRVEADRGAEFWIPKVRIIDSSGPGSFHYAYEPVRALDRRVIPLSVEDQDFSVVRNGFWGRASRQGYFGIPVFHQVLVKRGHVGISCASLLRLRPQYQAEYDRLCEEG